MKIFSFLTKVSAAALAAATILCCTSCSDTSWVVSAGEDTVSAGIYLGYLVDAYYSAATMATDTSADLFDQKIENMDADDYIRSAAMQSCKKHIAINRLFDEYKLSFTDEEAEDLQASVDSIWGNISSIYEENGCGKTSFTKIMEIEDKHQKIFEYYYSEDGKETVTEKERKEFFSKNYAKFKFINVSYSSHFSGVSSSSDASEAQKAELKEIAENYVTRLNNGEDIDALIAEEEAAGSKETEHTHKDSEEKEEVEEVAASFLQKDTSDDPDEFNKAVFEAKLNTPTMIENTTYGYYVLVRYETDADSEDYSERESSVLSAMKSEDFEEIVKKASDEIKVTENSSAIKRYKPQNVDLNIQ